MSHLTVLVIGQKLYDAPAWRFKNGARAKMPLASFVDAESVARSPEQLSAELAVANLVVIEQDKAQAGAGEKVLSDIYNTTTLPIVIIAPKRLSRSRPLKVEANADSRVWTVYGRYDLSLMGGDKGLLSVLRQAAFTVPAIAQAEGEPVIFSIQKVKDKKTICMEFKEEKKTITHMQSRLIAHLSDDRVHGNDLIMQNMYRKKAVGERERGLLRTQASRLSSELKTLFGYDPLHQEFGIGYKWVGPPIRLAPGVTRAAILAL